MFIDKQSAMIKTKLMGFLNTIE